MRFGRGAGRRGERVFVGHLVAFALLGTVAHPSPLAPGRPPVDRAPSDAGPSDGVPRAEELLCGVVIETLGCAGWIDSADQYALTQVADLCPGPCADALAAPPSALMPARRRLDENATEVWCLMKPDRTSFDLMGPTGCLSALPENFPGEHARRDEKVNGMMAETAAEPLHWALAYGSTFLLTCCSAFCSGLTLGLMGLDMTMIEVVKRSGTPADKARAQKIEPIRKTGNQLLC
eukprot:COSAG02_NODE_20904_length_811_cov_0.910112_1_plen_233_part_01